VAIRLVIADDHPIVLQGLQRLFEGQPDFDVVGAGTDGEQAIDAVRRLRPDVVLLDLRMPGRTGLDVLRSLAAEWPECRTVLLTATITDDEVAEAMRLGAAGIILKESMPETLLDCIRAVHAGQQWIDRESMAAALGRVLRREKATREASKTLTPRELEIVHMIAEALRNKAIAERLFIAEGTVKIHLHNIYEKLGVDGRLELVVYARQQGLV